LNHELAPDHCFLHACDYEFYSTHHMLDEMLERAFIHYHSGLRER